MCVYTTVLHSAEAQRGSFPWRADNPSADGEQCPVTVTASCSPFDSVHAVVAMGLQIRSSCYVLCIWCLSWRGKLTFLDDALERKHIILSL